MSKQELVEKMAEKAGLTKADAARALDAFTESVTEALKAGDKVSLVGFGTYATSERPAREGRNPRTGETVKIAARTAVTFKAGSKLRSCKQIMKNHENGFFFLNFCYNYNGDNFDRESM